MKDGRELNCIDEEEERRRGNEGVKTVVQVSMLCATILALICEIINLVEVIVNRFVSYPMFTLSFSILGVVATVYYLTKISNSRKLLAFGIVCIALAVAFAVLWLLSLFGVIK